MAKIARRGSNKKEGEVRKVPRPSDEIYLARSIVFALKLVNYLRNYERYRSMLDICRGYPRIATYLY
jgi:hypothetical protein